MQPAHIIEATDSLLTYSLVTSPTPVQVSPSTTVASVASLTFVVSCPLAGGAMVSQIVIILPVDTAGGTPDPINLASVAPPLSSASISSTGTDVWEVGAGPSPNIFIFSPKSGEPVQIKAQSLTIQFTGIKVNTVVGTALVKLNEVTARGSNPPPPIMEPNGLVTFAVAKFPYGFYVGNLTSDKPMVQNGQKPVLSWTGSVNAKYLMLYDENTVDVSTMRTWSPPQPLTKTTTFILQVSAQREGQTASIDFSITIEVSNPSLAAKDLAVLTNANIKGPLSVGTSSAPADLTLNGNLRASKDAIVNGSLTAANLNGNLTAPSANVGNLTANGPAKLMSTLDVTGAVKFAGALNTSGPLDTGGTVSVFKDFKFYTSIYGQVMAYTDGFLIGIVKPSNKSNACVTTITANSGLTVEATGGGVIGAAGACSSMLILPVRKNYMFFFGPKDHAPPFQKDWPSITYIWVPLGVAPASESDEVSAEDVTSFPAGALPALPFQLSGQARLVEGRATVQFLDHATLTADEQSYRVMLTPTELCAGLAVTQKSGNRFVVQELSDGKSNASFDWFVYPAS